MFGRLKCQEFILSTLAVLNIAPWGEYSEVLLRWLPEFHRGIKFQVPTIGTSLIIPFVLDVITFPSQFSTLLQVFSGITSQINYLFEIMFQNFCLWENHKLKTLGQEMVLQNGVPKMGLLIGSLTD